MNITENHQQMNQFQAIEGMKKASSKTVSGYILECKLKKTIWNIPVETIEQINEIRNRRSKGKLTYVDREELVSRLEKASIDTLQHFISLSEQEGSLEFLTCLMDMKK